VEALQGDLLATGPLAGLARRFDPAAPGDRIHLDASSWVDVVRGWLLGADNLMGELATALPWQQRRRRMWDRVVDEPRLTCWVGRGRPLPHPALGEIRAALSERQHLEFGAIGCNYYRGGNDSVASHRDQELRHLDDTIVAIVTCGARRPFLIRPRGGGQSLDVRPGSGDLMVMGGACQRDWEHGVPKVAACGPRISISLRWARSTPPRWVPS
jgi:alkylated DNA repair dioxygenase AlkB